MKNSIFARFARAFFIFWHFEDVLVLSTTWNYLCCSCVDDMSIWWQMFNFVFLCPKRWLQFYSRIVRTNFSSVMTLNNWKVIVETRSYNSRWRSCFRCRRVCSLITKLQHTTHETKTFLHRRKPVLYGKLFQWIFFVQINEMFFFASKLNYLENLDQK